MEVILQLILPRLLILSILHVCGGDPLTGLITEVLPPYSPRMWRWSQQHFLYHNHHLVFSTYVEVILIASSCAILKPSILHVCGGDPIELDSWNGQTMYSPRMWRWSFMLVGKFSCRGVFSTYVEVILATHCARINSLGILHVCGGDPDRLHRLMRHLLYSPRMWRWSFFPVFL